MPIRIKRRVIHRSANYTINPAVDRSGTLFLNGGASGAVTFTLPRPVAALVGDSYEVGAVADQTVTLAGRTAGDLITLDDAAADSVSLATTDEKIGGRIVAECVETAQGSRVYKWLTYVASVGHTGTVA